jgi:hypothetical protein
MTPDQADYLLSQIFLLKIAMVSLITLILGFMIGMRK